MLAAVQGVIRGNSIVVDQGELAPFDGRVVTIIINESVPAKSKQDKSKFFDAVGKIGIDASAVEELRSSSMI